MLNRILLISLCIIFLLLCITIFIAVHRGNIIESQNNQISTLKNDILVLQNAVNEQNKIIEVYAQADKQSKEFEGKLNEDKTDNLDVIPADYILNQLHAD